MHNSFFLFVSLYLLDDWADQSQGLVKQQELVALFFSFAFGSEWDRYRFKERRSVRKIAASLSFHEKRSIF